MLVKSGFGIPVLTPADAWAATARPPAAKSGDLSAIGRIFDDGEPVAKVGRSLPTLIRSRHTFV